MRRMQNMVNLYQIVELMAAAVSKGAH
jgi:hypothetical protein